jgi:hypothetical protein
LHFLHTESKATMKARIALLGIAGIQTDPPAGLCAVEPPKNAALLQSGDVTEPRLVVQRAAGATTLRVIAVKREASLFVYASSEL